MTGKGTRGAIGGMLGRRADTALRCGRNSRETARATADVQNRTQNHFHTLTTFFVRIGAFTVP